MGFDLHTLDVLGGSSPTAQPDRLGVLYLPGQANAAGGSAGASVTLAFTGLTLPATYAVLAQPSQDAFVAVTTKTQTGFDVVLTPTSGTVTLAAGTVDIVVLA